MKALTIWQPWASLLVSGQKKYETRSWATTYRGPIAIHAAMRPVRRTIDALVADTKGSGWNTIERFDSLFMRPAEAVAPGAGPGRLFDWPVCVGVSCDGPSGPAG